VTHLPEVKQPEHKADHPLRSSAEVKTRVAAYLPPLHAFTFRQNFITLYYFISICLSSSLKVYFNLQLRFPLVLSFSHSLRIFISSCP